MIDEKFVATENYPCLMESDDISLAETYHHTKPSDISLAEKHQYPAKSDDILWNGNFDNKILLIRPYPGLNYINIDLNSKPKAVLHYMYHSATACTTDGYSIIDFAKKCNDLGIDFYCASFKNKDAALYDSSAKIVNSGVIPLYNISCEAAYAKLIIMYNAD